MTTFKDFLQMNSKMSRTDIIQDFIKFAKGELQIETLPEIDISDDTFKAKEMRTFGLYNPSAQSIWVYAKNRNLADILRTLGHELVHHSQSIKGELYDGAGAAGTDIENEANSLAAVFMRKYGQVNNGIYEAINSSNANILMEKMMENQLQENIDDDFIKAAAEQHKVFGIQGKDLAHYKNGIVVHDKGSASGALVYHNGKVTKHPNTKSAMDHVNTLLKEEVELEEAKMKEVKVTYPAGHPKAPVKTVKVKKSEPVKMPHEIVPQYVLSMHGNEDKDPADIIWHTSKHYGISTDDAKKALKHHFGKDWENEHVKGVTSRLNEANMSGGEKAAYRMGMQHGGTNQKKINAEKSFGVYSKFYHMGYDSGKESKEWHDTQKDKSLLKRENVELEETSSFFKKSFIAQVGKFISDPSNTKDKKVKHSDAAKKVFHKLNVGGNLHALAEEFNLSESKMSEVDATVNSLFDQHVKRHGAEFVGAHLHGFIQKIAKSVSKQHGIPVEDAHELIKRKLTK